MQYDYTRPLTIARQLALEAGKILRDEYDRPGGARGHGDKADIDIIVERFLRRRLQDAFPTWGYLGEETGHADPAAGEPHVWIVDPNDGTTSFLKGWRGASVSLGLIRDGVPVLGVVYAYAWPDHGGEMLTWAEGCGPVRRDGNALPPLRYPSQLGPYDVVTVSRSADRSPASVASLVAPARYRPDPSLAHRMAMAATGDSVAGIGLFAPRSWDIAGAHALLRGAGGVLVDEAGEELRYDRAGHIRVSRCFGGGQAIVRELAPRPWHQLRFTRDERPPYDLVQLTPGRHEQDVGMVRRAQGCLLGQLTGDALGSLVEFQSAQEIAARPGGTPTKLEDGGTWQTIAGQPTDDSEMALMLARSLLQQGGFDVDSVRAAYGYWGASGPFDIGNTTASALQGRFNPQSQANGSLMRISPLAIAGARWDPLRLATAARQDAMLTHVHRACGDATALFAVTVAHAIQSGASAEAVYAFAEKMVGVLEVCPPVADWLLDAQSAPPEDFSMHAGWVRVAFQNAFYRLLHTSSATQGIVDTVARGGDTDTNAAIAGALLGAVFGRDSLDEQWRHLVTTCRPVAAPHTPGAPPPNPVQHPRPRGFWPIDALPLAERLLVLDNA